MNKKTTIALIASAIAIAGLVGIVDNGILIQNATAADGDFGGGDGTLENPFFIEDVRDLQNMSANLSAHYVLASNINASATITWNDGAGFQPVGSQDAQFTGSLDGGNHTITGLYINSSGSSNIGLFGVIGSEGGSRNLVFKGISLIGGLNTGALAGTNGGTIAYSHSVGAISGDDFVGGLVGFNGGMVSNSSAVGSVTGIQGVGGLVGGNHGSVLQSYANATVTGNNAVGGLVGTGIYGSQADTYATGIIIRPTVSDGTDFGGYIGINKGGRITNSYSTVQVIYENADDPEDKGFAGSVIEEGDLFEMVGNIWDIEASGQTSTAGNATGLDTVDLKSIDTLWPLGWGIAHVGEHNHETWYIDDGYDYPRLWWEDYIDTRPPVADAGPNQTIGMGDTAYLDASHSTDNMGIENYSWTFNDGVEDVTLYGVSLSYKFFNPGVFVVTLNVTDAADNGDVDTMTITVNDTEAPVVSISSNPMSPVDQHTTVNFTAEAVDNHSPEHNLSYRWVVNDVLQEGENSRFFNFTFSEPGEYSIRVNVTDDASNVGFNETTYVVESNIAISVGPVVDANGDPVSGAEVSITLDGETYTSITDQDGIASITMPSSSSGTPLNITISKTGYKTISFSATADEEGSLDAAPHVMTLESDTEQPACADCSGSLLLYAILMLVGASAVLIIQGIKKRPPPGRGGDDSGVDPKAQDYNSTRSNRRKNELGDPEDDGGIGEDAIGRGDERGSGPSLSKADSKKALDGFVGPQGAQSTGSTGGEELDGGQPAPAKTYNSTRSNRTGGIAGGEELDGGQPAPAKTYNSTRSNRTGGIAGGEELDVPDDHKAAKTGRNPQTGKEVQIAAKDGKKGDKERTGLNAVNVKTRD